MAGFCHNNSYIKKLLLLNILEFLNLSFKSVFFGEKIRFVYC